MLVLQFLSDFNTKHDIGLIRYQMHGDVYLLPRGSTREMSGTQLS